jgi:DNA-binding response OmpR family regulator
VDAAVKVALVSVRDRARTVLAEYLRNSGFDVHQCEDLAIGSAFPALILLTHEMPVDDVRARVKAWMKPAKTRVVVVTPKPSALDELRTLYPDRLAVFPPPVFGWDVVDALRGIDPTRPRSA